MTFTINDADIGGANEQVSDTTLAFSPTSAVAVNQLAILLVTWDNVDGTNADDTTFLSVADTKSNAWFRAGEAQFSAGSALDGVLNGIFYSVITTQIEVTDTITITSTANGTSKGCALASFNRDSAKTIEVVGQASQRQAAVTSYSVSVGPLTSEEHLWIGQNCREGDRNGTNTIDSTFTAILAAGAAWGGTGGGTGNVGGRGGYKISTSTGETYDATALASSDRCDQLVAFREIAGGAGAVVLDPMGMSGFFGG
jgi:hypothetical protein